MARISFIGDDGEELEITIGPNNPDLFVGRHKTCAIRTANPSVSRQHARVFFDGEFYWLQDNGSSNGTFYQNRRLEPQEPVQIESGEYLLCGNFEMRFDYDDDDLVRESGVTYDDEPAPDYSVEPTRAASSLDVLGQSAAPPPPPPPPPHGFVPPPPPGAYAPPAPHVAADAAVPANAQIAELEEALHARDRELQSLRIELESLSVRAASGVDPDAHAALQTRVAAAEAAAQEAAELSAGLRAALASAQTEAGALREELLALQAAGTADSDDEAHIATLTQELSVVRELLRQAEDKFEEARAGRRNAEELAAMLRMRAEMAEQRASAAPSSGGDGPALLALQEQLRESEAQRQALLAQLEQATAEVAAAHAMAAAAQADAESARSKSESEQSRAESAQAGADAAQAQLLESRAERDALAAQLALVHAEAAVQRDEVSGSSAELEAARAQSEAARAAAEAAASEARAASADAEAARADAADARAALRAAESVLHAEQAARSAAAAEQAALSEQLAQAQQHIAQLQTALAASEAQRLAPQSAPAADPALAAQLEQLRATNRDLEVSASANLKRIQRLMRELEEARAAGAGGAAIPPQVTQLVTDINGVASSFRSDFLSMRDAYDMMASEDAAEREDAWVQLQDGLESCMARSTELKDLVLRLRQTVGQDQGAA